MVENCVKQTAENGATQFGIVEGNVTIINYPPPPTPVETKSHALLADKSIPDNPYRGLFAFRPEHASIFFGRDHFTQRLVRAIEFRSLVVVLGASGSGKSSVVFAGLIPALKASGRWLFATFRPGNDPFQGLTEALVPFLYQDPADQITAARKLSTGLREGDILLSDIIGKIEQTQSDCRLLLVADQFEELYTLCPDVSTRRHFLDALLGGLAQPTDPSLFIPPSSFFTLVLTLRADFMEQASRYSPFANALQNTTELLGPMNRLEMSQAIEKPAALQNVNFEAKLVERLLEDVGEEEGSLPLLEFALTELWQHQDNNRRLTHTAYEAIGQIRDAISRHADKVCQSLSPAEQEQARRIFVQLVKPGLNSADTRRLATLSELEREWPLVVKLANERLVVTNQTKDGPEMVELVHEALIHRWERLRSWVVTDREFRIWQERLRIYLSQWQASQDNEDLLAGSHLSVASDWLKKRHADLTPVEMKFIERSKSNDAIRRRDIVFFLMLAGGLGAAISVGFIAALAAYLAWQPDHSRFFHLPLAPVIFMYVLMGGLLGAAQGSMTTLGFTLAEIWAGKSSLYRRLIGGLLGGGGVGGGLFMLFRLAGVLPTDLPYATVFASGFITFGLSSGAVTLIIPEIRQQRSFAKPTILGAIAAGAACFVAVWFSYQLFDQGAGSPFLETAQFFSLLESMFGGGLALGLVLARRLGYMLR